MPYIDNDGVQIHYHLDGQGPPMVVLHGLTSDLHDMYEYGLVQGLRDEYQLILVDSRGHGKSGKPHSTNAYSSEAWSSDIVAVLDDLEIDKAHFYGYSMGGWIGWCLAKHFPERFHSFVIGGQHPFKKDNPEEWTRRIGMYEQGMEVVAQDTEKAGVILTPQSRANLLANDHNALVAVAIAMRDDPGLEDVLNSITIPFLLIAGEQDGYYAGIQRTAGSISNVEFVSLQGLNHIGLTHPPF